MSTESDALEQPAVSVGASSTKSKDRTGNRCNDVDVEALVERIRAALRMRGAGALSDSGGAGDRIPPETAASNQKRFSSDLYRSLHQANVIAVQGLQVHYELGWRTPVIGHAWMWVRRIIHQEIRIYVDALLSQQSALNSYLVRALSSLTKELTSARILESAAAVDAQAESIEDMRREIELLKGRVEQLEAALSTSSPVEERQ